MKKAFTLVELSIVLVIIGLLTAGVIGGQSLIESAKINSQVSQLKSYETSVAAFRLEYDALPGDMKSADASAYGFTSGAGNGDGIYNDSGGSTPPVSAWVEPYMGFIHLSQANLLNTNQAHKASSFSVGAGEPFPEDKMGRGGVALVSLADRKSYFFLGPTIKNDITNKYFFNDNSASPSFTGKEAFRLDSKIDDGIPNVGAFKAVIVTNTSSTNFGVDTATGTTACLATTSTYNVAGTTVACRLLSLVKSN